MFEDESRLIGRCVIPTPFFEKLRELPRILLEANNEERSLHIYGEYIEKPLLRRTPEQVMELLVGQLRTLKNRLGGEACEAVEKSVREAFGVKNPAEAKALHCAWILRLLNDYYDGLYKHAMARHPREPVFRGNAQECADWLRKNADLLL